MSTARRLTVRKSRQQSTRCNSTRGETVATGEIAEAIEDLSVIGAAGVTEGRN
jgi:hypothetical protein